MTNENRQPDTGERLEGALHDLEHEPGCAITYDPMSGFCNCSVKTVRKLVSDLRARAEAAEAEVKTVGEELQFQHGETEYLRKRLRDAEAERDARPTWEELLPCFGDAATLAWAKHTVAELRQRGET